MDAATLLEGLRRADYLHDGGVRCLRRLRLESEYMERLRLDVARLCASERGSDVGDSAHPTHWTRPRGAVTQFSLLNRSGRYDDHTTDHDLSCRGKSVHAAAAYPVLGEFVAALPHAVNCRLNVLGPGAELGAHEENAVIRTRAGGVAARVRFHLPLFTNPGAEIVLDGDVYHLEAGVIHLVNNGCVHSARNRGRQSRVHLVFDLLLTARVFACMFGAESLALPVRSMAATEEVMTPLRVEQSPPPVRLTRQVDPAESRRLAWCPVQ